MEKMDGKTMEEWISYETRKRTTTFWGRDFEIEPVICSEIQGDGLQLVWLSTINQRPDYWLLRIDSSTDIESDDFDEETLLWPLEAEFGCHPDCLLNEEEFYKALKDDNYKDSDIHNYDSFEEYDKACEYPSVLWGGGFWGLVVNFKTGESGCYENI